MHTFVHCPKDYTAEHVVLGRFTLGNFAAVLSSAQCLTSLALRGSVAFVLLGSVPNWLALSTVDLLQLVCMLVLATRALMIF